MAKKEVKKVIEVLKKVAVAECAVCKEVVCKCEPEIQCFVKLGKNTFAMQVPGGVIVRHRDSLVHVPGVKILALGKVNVLANI
jgi:hypothetical protein